MGSPISGVIAEAVLHDLERNAMEHLQTRFWARYVDDTFVIIKREDKGRFIAVLTGVCSDMQFTMDEEEYHCLPFLDVLITRHTYKTAIYEWQCTGRPPTRFEHCASIAAILICTQWRVYAQFLVEWSLTAPLQMRNEKRLSTFTGSASNTGTTDISSEEVSKPVDQVT